MDRSESEESLDVPEEPKEDTTEDEFDTKASKLGVPTDGKARRPSTALNFSTAVKIARWMARAYGYMAKKRKTYLVSTIKEKIRSQEVVNFKEIQNKEETEETLKKIAHSESFAYHVLFLTYQISEIADFFRQVANFILSVFMIRFLFW